MIENAPGGKDPGYFGHGVLGRDRYEREKALVEKGANVFGPGVTGQPNVMGPGVTEQGREGSEQPTEPMLSVKDMEAALEANPLLVDKFLSVELARPGGPRKGALLALENAEAFRPGGSREDVLAKLEAAFAETE